MRIFLGLLPKESPCIYFTDTVSSSEYVTSNKWMKANNELETMWK